MSKFIYKCKKCNSTNVEIKEWVSPNKNFKYVGNEFPEDMDTWCRDCEDNTGINIIELPK